MMQIAVYDFGLHEITDTFKDQLSRILQVGMIHFDIMNSRLCLKVCKSSFGFCRVFIRLKIDNHKNGNLWSG
jgi:hypothetical protein